MPPDGHPPCIDLTSSPNVTRIRPRETPTATPLPTIELAKCTHQNVTYRVGKSRAAELNDKPQMPGRFIGIRKIFERGWPGSSEVFVSGPVFESQGQLNGILPLKVNEVCIVEEFYEVSIDKLGNPRTLIMTNKDYPEFAEKGPYRDPNWSRIVLEDHGRLVCRWRLTRAASKKKVDGATLERLRPDEVPVEYRVDEIVLWRKWRMHLNPGDSPAAVSNGQPATPAPTLPEYDSPSRSSTTSVELPSLLTPESTIDATSVETTSLDTGLADDVTCTGYQNVFGGLFLDDDIEIVDEFEANGLQIISSSMLGRANNQPDGPDPESLQPDEDKYTFGDGFCGGGGMASGAWAAGFHTKWAFDHERVPVETYRRNFPQAHVYEANVHDFIVKIQDDLRVDVLHLSPPCQPHSPAHTIAGKNDEANEAAGLTLSPCLLKSRPRVATLEQTFGILNRAREQWFYSMIQSFTSNGWNVRWKVHKCVEYGVPQLRKRLIVIGSCPGERLPEWPEVHWRDPSTKFIDCDLMRPRTLEDCIGDIPPTASHQTEHYFPEGRRVPKSRWDTPLTHTILAGGGNYDVHPNGQRRFTVRELASIQTFPPTHDFIGSDVEKKKQIGNAVPPLFAQQILRKVRQSLEMEDKRHPIELKKWQEKRGAERKRIRDQAEKLPAKKVLVVDSRGKDGVVIGDVEGRNGNTQDAFLGVSGTSPVVID